MTKKSKWLSLAALVFGGSTVFQSGCLNLEGFWGGLFGAGWPTDNRWLNIAIDVLNEELFG